MRPRPNLVYTYKGFTPGPAGCRVKREVLEEIDRRGNLAWTKNGVQRKLRPADVEKGKPVGSLWIDIPPINSQAKERLGYPTQKPFKILREHHTGKLSARRACVRPVLRLRYGG